MSQALERAQINRQNSKHSTGPRTIMGKSRVAKNAIKHGLSASYNSNADRIQRSQRLTEGLISGGSDIIPIGLAREIADAQVEILFIREIRANLLSKAFSLVTTATGIGGSSRENDFETRFPNFDDTTKESHYAKALLPTDCSISIAHDRQPILKFPQEFGRLVDSISRLERYERRAMTRRKKTIESFSSPFQKRLII